jgi:hypothetical protein
VLNFTQSPHKTELETPTIDASLWFKDGYDNMIPKKNCCQFFGIFLFSLQLHHLVPGQTVFLP